MPLYEYKCTDCGTTVEVIQKFSDDPLTQCKNCGGELERLLSAPTIQFKGAGWYINDYARKNGADKETSASSKEDKSDSSKADTKSDSKSTPAETAVKSNAAKQN